MKTNAIIGVSLVVLAAHLAGCANEEHGSATGKVLFDGKEYTFTHPVAAIGVWPHKLGIRTLRVDLFQEQPEGKHVKQIKATGMPMFMGKETKTPHLVLNMHVKNENVALRKDAVEFVGVTIQAISDPWINQNVTGPSITRAHD